MVSVGDTAEEILVTLGRRLAAHRLSLGLTQADLAARSGISKPTVERLEKGEARLRMDALVRVCMTLGLVTGFDALVPEVVLGPQALARGEVLPKRARKSHRAKIQWGDEK